MRSYYPFFAVILAGAYTLVFPATLFARIFLFAFTMAACGAITYCCGWMLVICGRGALRMIMDKEVRRSTDLKNAMGAILGISIFGTLMYFSIKSFYYWAVNFWAN